MQRLNLVKTKIKFSKEVFILTKMMSRRWINNDKHLFLIQISRHVLKNFYIISQKSDSAKKYAHVLTLKVFFVCRVIWSRLFEFLWQRKSKSSFKNLCDSHSLISLYLQDNNHDDHEWERQTTHEKKIRLTNTEQMISLITFLCLNFTTSISSFFSN